MINYICHVFKLVDSTYKLLILPLKEEGAHHKKVSYFLPQNINLEIES